MRGEYPRLYTHAPAAARSRASALASAIAGDGGENCNGPTSSEGHLDLSFDVSFDEPCEASIHSDPKLGALQDNGGPTETMGLAAGSPARDVVPGSGGGCPASDQRGVARPQGAGCDLGAYEVAPPLAVTGGAGALSASSATLSATVTANAGDAAVRLQYGTTTAYGSETPLQHVGGVTPTALADIVSSLSANTTYHFRVVASAPDGTSIGADETFTTSASGSPPGAEQQGASSGAQQGPSGGGGRGTPPSARIASLSGLSETNAIFAVGARSTPLSGQTASKRHAKGTVFSFALDRAATVRIAIQSSAPGRRVGHGCRPYSAKLRTHPRCIRTRAASALC